MDIKTRAQSVFKILDKKYKNHGQTGLKNWKNDWQYLFCVILSARVTDDQVNKVTKNIFEKYKNLEDFVKADLKVLSNDIHRLGFYNSKSRHIQKAAQIIIKYFKSKIPNKIEDLIKIPGVGRKTANVFQQVILGKSEGIAVDTHVGRLSQRLGFTKMKDPKKIELDLMKIFKKEQFYRINPILFWHGRTICLAKKPNCDVCEIKKLCKSAFKFLKL